MTLQGTTILAVRHAGATVIAGDGQITLSGSTVMKATARKVQRIYGDKVIVGFAGAVADALALRERLEGELAKHGGNLPRAAVEMAREWRTDRVLRRLEAMLVAADRDHLLVLSGGGEVIEPDDGLAGIGSGGSYALAAARAMVRFGTLSAREIAVEGIRIAAGICVFTNEQIVVEEA